MAGKHEERHLIQPAKGSLLLSKEAKSATVESVDQTENNLQKNQRRGTVHFVKNVIVQRMKMQNERAQMGDFNSADARSFDGLDINKNQRRNTEFKGVGLLDLNRLG
jgi:transposase